MTTDPWALQHQQRRQQHQDDEHEHQTLSCPRDLVGRVIGKAGSTVKGIQCLSGAVIELDQTLDPATIVIAGRPKSIQLATSVIQDILAGTFKGFALLRQLSQSNSAATTSALSQAGPLDDRYVYSPGLGLFPKRQLFAATSGHTVTAAAPLETPAALGLFQQLPSSTLVSPPATTNNTLPLPYLLSPSISSSVWSRHSTQNASHSSPDFLALAQLLGNAAPAAEVVDTSTNRTPWDL